MNFTRIPKRPGSWGRLLGCFSRVGRPPAALLAARLVSPGLDVLVARVIVDLRATYFLSIVLLQAHDNLTSTKM